MYKININADNTSERKAGIMSAYKKMFIQADTVDISTIKTDSSKNTVSRMVDYLKTVKSPYFFKVDDISVRLAFKENGDNISELICRLLQA